MESLGKTAVVFVDGRKAEYDDVELLAGGVLKVLRTATREEAQLGVHPAGATEYKAEYYPQHAWALAEPASTTTRGGTHVPGTMAAPPRPRHGR
jgi:hypothetical protein